MRKIVAALLIGFLIAGAGTKIIYACPPVGTAGCVSFDKAVMHPGDLLRNKQSSLVHFSETFVLTSVIMFALLSVLSVVQTRKVKKIAT